MGDTTQLNVLTSRLQEAFKNSRKSESSSRILRSTLKDLTPVVEEIKQYNEYLNSPRKEIKTLINGNHEVEKEGFLCNCSLKSSLCWHKCIAWLQFCMCRFRDMKDDSFAVDEKQDLMAKDVKETLYKMREILEFLNKENFELKLNGSGGTIIKRPFGVPENTKFTVGLDVPLSKLKMELLKDGMSTLLLTGLGGSGKTTLATKLCWDEQIKGKS